MAGLLAWAADVVGGNGMNNEEEEEEDRFVVMLSPEQQAYARKLEARATTLRRSVDQLRQRLPPPHISQRLPHLHAHSLASNAALALQLNAHSATKQQVLEREASLQEENAAYEKAISISEKQIQEKMEEADLMENNLKEMDLIEKRLKTELEETQAAWENRHSDKTLDDDSIRTDDSHRLQDEVSSKGVMLEELDKKKKEVSSMEEMVQHLENKKALLEHDSVRQPSPAQREKMLEKQLQSLMEQLAAKQAQAEGLATEIHVKGMELDKLNGLKRKIENRIVETTNTTRRTGRIPSSFSADLATDESNTLVVGTTHRRASGSGNQQKLVLLRSAFVLYILVLHLLVFIKISFA